MFYSVLHAPKFEAIFFQFIMYTLFFAKTPLRDMQHQNTIKNTDKNNNKQEHKERKSASGYVH